MKRILSSLLFGVFLLTMVGATVTQLTFNSPDDGHVSQDAYRLLNVTVYNDDLAEGIDFIIYGSNDTLPGNNSIIFRQANISNGTTITYNWTSPKIRSGDDSKIALLMYFDNQSREYVDNVTVDNSMVLLYRMDNSSTFDESESAVFDFSDARNNGSVSGGIVNTSGRFTGALQFNISNYIDSGNSNDFNISNGLSMEGWFYPFGDGREIGNVTRDVIDDFEFDSNTYIAPKTIHIGGNIYATVYNGKGARGVIQTFDIFNNGTINRSIQRFEYNTTEANEPDIALVSGDTYAIVYSGPGGDGFVQTLDILSNGTINGTVDAYEFDSGQGVDPEILKITDTIYAIVYQGSGSDGFVASINITDNGTITKSVIDSLEFDTQSAFDPDIVQVSGEIYAIVSESQGADGFLDTINITDSGTISNSVISSLEFDTSNGEFPSIKKVSDQVYAIAYDGGGGDGFIATFNITDDGTINGGSIDSLEFDTSVGTETFLTNITNDIFLVSYNGPDNDGFLVSVNITSNGSISNSVIGSLEFDTSDSDTPQVIKLGGGNVSVVYEGPGRSDRDGFMKTVEVLNNGTILGVLETNEFENNVLDTGQGLQPEIIYVSGEVYAVVYQGGNGDGFVKTLTITSNGTVNQSAIDIYEFDTSSAITPKMIHINESVFGVVYEGPGEDGFVSTMNIFGNGTISSIASFEYNTTDGTEPDIIRLNGTIYAVPFRADDSESDDGWISTLEILDNGTIGSIVDVFEFNGDYAEDPEIIKINDTFYGIVYESNDSNGFLTTLQILHNGTVNGTVQTLEFDTGQGTENEIFSIKDNVYAILSSGTGADGFLNTYTILPNGTIITTPIDTFEYDSSEGEEPDMIHLFGDRYAIVADGPGDDGWITTVEISSDGSIRDSIIDNYEYDSVDGDEPDIIHISGDIYAIAYDGDETSVRVKTLNIATDKGISKTKSYSLYSNSTTAFGSILGQTLSADIVSGWNHLALVYNKSLGGAQQKLYVNGQLAASGTLTDNITINHFNLSVGRNFEGLLDDIAVYNRTLGPDEIEEHAGIKLLDESGLNNGTGIYNNDNFNYSGKLGGSLSFDGTEDVLTVNDSGTLDLVNDFSIGFWANPTSLNSNMTFISKGSGTSGTNYFVDYKTTNKIEFGFYNGDFRSISVDGSNVTANKWSLIIATWNETGNMSRVYINGIERGSLQINQDVLANSFDLKVGWFPGYDQNFTGLIDELVIYNKTLNSSDVTNIYQLKSQDWYWKFSGKDSGGINMSTTRNFLVGTVWDISPSDLGSVGAELNINVSVGTLVINNTHPSKNITINITEDFGGVVTYNETLPLTLYNTNNGSNQISIQINVTSPVTEGSTTINFNITANDTNAGGDSVPASTVVPVDVVASSGNPFLITAFETVPTAVSQNNTGITLKASVVNRGQGNAQSVVIQYVLPSGWTNSSGDLNSSSFIVNVNDQKNYSIEVDIAENATSGVVTLYANVTGQNDTGGTVADNLKTVGDANVTVNAVSSGTGPTVEVVTEAAARSSGGGGGGGASESSGGSIESVAFSETIEIIRGSDGEASFEILVIPKYRNSSLENLTLTITGYPGQYVEVVPNFMRRVRFGEAKNFTITLSAPSYADSDQINLTATIRGKLVLGSGVVSDYVDRRSINLRIQEIALSPLIDLLKEAKDAIELMKENGFNIDEVDLLLEEAEKKLEERRNKESGFLARKIVDIKDLAFRADELIGLLNDIIEDPRKISLLSGDVVRSFRERNSALTGNVIIESQDVQEVLNLALSAFERGDYSTALERAQSARLLLIIEGKGSFFLFFYTYWHYILVAGFAFSVLGISGYRAHQKVSISRKISDINIEEDNSRKVFVENQQKYYVGKISSFEYHNNLKQHQKRLAAIKKKRLRLRHKRVRLLKSSKVIRDLGLESNAIENQIKQIQFDYYRDRKVGKSEYNIQYDTLNERQAEIEEERTMLHFTLNKNVKVTNGTKEKNLKDSRPENILDKKMLKFEGTKSKVGLGKKISERMGKKGKREGVAIVDKGIVDIVKKGIEGKDAKNKWIRINLEKSDIAKQIMEEKDEE